MSTPRPTATNRLAHSTSPYLQQHADNPVDWYPWGDEAIQRARSQDKPIFLSIGYSACHWCHVMAHESFENEEIAALMNEHFVNIKVDREERPDLDEIYMQATLVLNQGQGGWPMSVWLTPELKPFFAGTYFPPTARYGRAGFKELCSAIAKAWDDRRDEIVTQSERLTEVVQTTLRAAEAGGRGLQLGMVDATAEALAEAFDSVSGGLVSGHSNKFPPSMALELMLRSAQRRDAEDPKRRKLRDLAELTLDHMATGGIYDQIGGGIHRYSTDVEWHVPHFEKMLYDQALVGRVYIDAFQALGKQEYADVARGIFDYVLDDLQSPHGGFYSARDADSDGEEGKYYVWTREEIIEILGEECGQKFCAHYDISESGNWKDPHAPGVAKNIPRKLRETCTCAKMWGISREEFDKRLGNAREKVLDARKKRVPPARDEKILVEWNGLMVASLARGGVVLDEPRYVDAARSAATFLLENQQRDDGRLIRAWRDGRSTKTAFLSDYAALIDGLIELYEATFERRWLEEASRLNKLTIEHFWDESGGAFYFTPDDHEDLIARSKDVRDNATPSGNSLQLMNLLRLSVMLGDEGLRERAEKMMTVLSRDVQQSPGSAERFLAAVEFARIGPLEIAIVGDPSRPETKALLAEVHGRFLPNRVVMLHDPARPDASPDSPLLANRTQIDNKPTAYVCRDYACQKPVNTPHALGAQLDDRAD